MEKNKLHTVLFTAVLAVLLIQTLQLNALAAEVSGQEADIVRLEADAQKISETAVSASTRKSAGTGGSVIVPDSIKNLPNMVGGC